MIPVNDNDPVILSWAIPLLTDENKEFFQGFNVTISRTVFTTTLNQRRKRNIPSSDTLTIPIPPDQTSYTYNQTCPYDNSLTLCPYSEYCFSVVSLFAFKDTFIGASDSTSTTMCRNTEEAGEFTILKIVLYLM